MSKMIEFVALWRIFLILLYLDESVIDSSHQGIMYLDFWTMYIFLRVSPYVYTYRLSKIR